MTDRYLDAGEEAQVEAAGDLDGLQGQRGGVEGESDWINQFGVQEELGSFLPVPQTSLMQSKRKEVRKPQKYLITSP